MVAVNVSFTEYALMKMHQRDILEEEVMAALALRSGHRRRRDGRRDVRVRTNRRVLLVVYRLDENEFLVINAMWE